jgi:CheY-like chemotaxis protein
MRSVLVVEDEADVREFERALLECAGYDVRTACNGAEGLRDARERPPAVILLDLMMPVMDGLTFLRERRDDHRIQRVPVVCVTAGGREMVAHALRLGASRCLQKPTDIDELCSVLAEYAKP